MKKGVVFAILLLSNCLLSAQGKQAANWCFGYHAGINFSDTSNVTTFISAAKGNFELAASISDSAGNLLLQLGLTREYDDTLSIFNGNNEIILNGFYIKSNPSFSRGANFLPDPAGTGCYYLLYTYWLGSPPTPYGSFELLYSKICFNESLQEYEVVEKDQEVFEAYLDESNHAVQHANGRDWWITAHQKHVPSDSVQNIFYHFLLDSTGLNFHHTQSIGSIHDVEVYGNGYPNFSRSGNLMSYAHSKLDYVDLYQMNRCTGMLENYQVVDNGVHEWSPYSTEFSPNDSLLYVVYSEFSGSPENWLYQYDLYATDIQASRQLLFEFTNPTQVDFGAIELAYNDKIYLTSEYNNYPVQWNQNLTVINQPNKLGAACDVQPFSVYLGDTVFGDWSLPNMPNYNLGPLSIYQTDAGKDTAICLDDTINIKSVPIGQAPVPGVQYQWVAGDSIWYPDSSYTFVNPSQTTTYVLEITDTNITNACQTRYDTVVVEVKNCYTSVPQIAQQNLSYKLYPNPIESYSQGYTTLGTGEQGQLQVFNLQGVEVLNVQLTEGLNTISYPQTGMPPGVYLYKIWVEGEQKTTDKLVKVQ